MATQAKVTRTVPGLIGALQKKVDLLKERVNRAFYNGEFAMLGEIAGILRVLIHDHADSKALLLDLMALFEFNPKLVLEHGPIPEQTLEEYLAKHGCAVATTSGQVYMTCKEFVATWAQHEGATHEDWEQDERFVAGRQLAQNGLSIRGSLADVYMLKHITDAVLITADAFLKSLTKAAIRHQARGQGSFDRPIT
jgi:hypothetical protein